MRIIIASALRFTDAGNAPHEIRASSEIVVSAQLPGNMTHLIGPSCLQPRNVAENHASQPRLVDMFEPGLQPRNVLLDLLDEGQKVRKLRQALIRRDSWLLHGSRAGRNQCRIERIVLGPPKMQPRKVTHLVRLQDQDGEARSLQMPDHATFITARRLDSHAPDTSLGQLRTQTSPTLQRILNTPARGLTVNRDIELVFGRIDPGHCCANLRHLRRPLPCEANQVVPATIRVR
jgi:hypothetical protein